jgi:hypothetical protein
LSAGQASYDELSEQLAVTRERLRLLAALLAEILATRNTVVSDEQWEIWVERARLDAPAEQVPAAAARLEEIRATLAAFDWEMDDRQLALEAIDRIVNGGQA